MGASKPLHPKTQSLGQKGMDEESYLANEG